MGIKDIESLTIDDIKPITISFKKNEDELILYKWILKHSGYSSFVKDTLREEMERETPKEKEAKRPDKENKLLDLDI